MQSKVRRPAVPRQAGGAARGSVQLLGLGPGTGWRAKLPTAAAAGLWTDAPDHPALAVRALPLRLLPALPRAAAALLWAEAQAGDRVHVALLGDPEQDAPALVEALRALQAEQPGPSLQLTAAPAWWPRALADLAPLTPSLDGSWQWASAPEILRERHPWLDPGRPALLRLDGRGDGEAGRADEAAGRAAVAGGDPGHGGRGESDRDDGSAWPRLRAHLALAYGPDHRPLCLGWRGETFALPLGLDARDAGLPPGARLLYLPPLDPVYSWPRLLAVVAHLRAPDGCPWDREQTHQSLRPYLLEEAYEAVEALDAGDWPAFCDELGDLLLQVVLHAQVAVDEDRFAIRDVLAALTGKLIRRHPHVFGDVAADTADEVLANWEALKRAERAAKSPPSAPAAGASEEQRSAWAALEGIPKAMPALARAQLVLRKARRQPALASQLPDAAAEHLGPLLDRALAGRTEAHLGELLWRLAAWAQDAGLDAEEALRGHLSRLPQASATIAPEVSAASPDPAPSR